MSETTVAVAVVQCTKHGQKAVLVGDTRITPNKCCGQWDNVVYHWPNVTEFDVSRALEQFATPPTPDLAAVVARVQAYLDGVKAFVQLDDACELLDEPGHPVVTLQHADLRTLLAHLTRGRE